MLKFLLVVAVVGVVTYLAVRLMQRRLPGGGSPAPRRPLPGPKPKPRMVAPDDDEAFLRDLERKRRHPEDPDTPA
ncbi:hypothetical protein JOE61_002596 [Nocardioides salarius]|uniref:Uncharacterized protein n=1 Tax=Nocardioides salarius TaxID=374513 RepID=A0ABS2MC51_9ACTN|nr:hypothetical protein [Nocardioides salarius]MBM7508782.1 hypothetical protein [Nocardioides salarius]